jgi:3-oxoacyl-[acyl-carrier-protein] synthase-3
MIYSKVMATGGYLPAHRVSNDELALSVDTSDEWIVSRTGIHARHVAKPDELTSDLACCAAEVLFKNINTQRHLVDLLIIATTTPDSVFPSTACIVQKKLGLKANIPVFDIQAVCAGFLYALSTADAYIRSGKARSVLVIGAETMTKILNWEDRSTCVLFGDGAGAILLEASSEPGIHHCKLAADGNYSEILSVPGQIRSGKISGSPYLQMDGQAVFRFAVKALSQIALDTLAEANMTKDQVDWLIPHQANMRIIQSTAKHLGLPMDRVIVTLAEQGNTSSASVPLAFDAAIGDGRIKRGDTVLLEGIGGGFAWGAALLTF